MTQLFKKDNYISGYVRNCTLIPRDDGNEMFVLNDKSQIIATLDNYTILPTEQYLKLIGEEDE